MEEKLLLSADDVKVLIECQLHLFKALLKFLFYMNIIWFDVGCYRPGEITVQVKGGR